MAGNRTRRIAKELADIHADTHSQITAEPIGGQDDVTHLRGIFPGPPDTPYEGGTYKVDIKIPTDYPFRPPVMKFETKVWHPNISSQTVSGFIDPSLVEMNMVTYRYVLGCYLPRHSLQCLVPCSHHQIRFDLIAVLAEHSRA